jgi:hypothetical protein
MLLGMRMAGVERLSFDWTDDTELLAVRVGNTRASGAALPASASSAAASTSVGRFVAGFVSFILALVALLIALVLPITLLLL